MRHASNKIIRRGFTLIEILVVVAIIAVLIGILIIYMGKARGQPDKAAAVSQLNGLQLALQQYYADFGMYPPSSPVYSTIPVGRGGTMLAQGLMGFLNAATDGAANGPPGDPNLGFRTHPSGMGGAIYGPYASDNNKTYKNGPSPSFYDPWGNDILYFRASGIPPVAGNFNIFDKAVNGKSFFFYDDCTTTSTGAVPNPTTLAPAVGGPFFKLISANNTNAYTGGAVTGSDSYLLISAGPDGIYFTSDDIVVGKP